MKNKNTINIWIVFCLCTETILAQSTPSQKDYRNIIYVKSESKNNYNVDIGSIEYGQVEPIIFRFVVSDFNVNQIARLKRVGCGACSGAKRL